MKQIWRIISLILMAVPAMAGVMVTELQGTGSNHVIVIENPAMKITVDPARSGRVASFIWKTTGKNWVLDGQVGFFMDHVWQQKWPGELLDKTYDVKIMEKGPDRVSVQASIIIEGKGDKAIEGVRLIRTMTVLGDGPRVDVTIRLENPTSELRSPGLWVQNVINVGGSRDNVWTWRSTAHGMVRASFDTKTACVIPAGYKDDFAYDPIAGWTAETFPPTGEAVVFLMDYNYLRCLYNNAGSQSVEWWYDQSRLAPGKAFETKFTLWALNGMTGITHASQNMVGDLQMAVQGNSLTLVNRIVNGPETISNPVKVKLQLINYDTSQEIQSREFEGVTVSSVPVEQKLTVADVLMNNLLARVTVTTADGKSQVYEQYRHGPAVMGTEKKYKTIRTAKIRPIVRPAMSGKTPHQGFRILNLQGMFEHYYRIPEAAGKMNAEVKNGDYSITVYGPGLSYFPGDYSELMAYDLIVLNNIPLEALDDQTQAYLVDYVQNGGALLVIGGHWAFGGGRYKGSKLEEALPVTTKGPFDVLPMERGILNPQPDGAKNVCALWVQDVIPRSQAQISVHVGDKPFWIQWKYGKGVAAVMTGVCYGEAPRRQTLFTEWPGWPEWLANRIKAMVETTDK